MNKELLITFLKKDGLTFYTKDGIRQLLLLGKNELIKKINLIDKSKKYKRDPNIPKRQAEFVYIDMNVANSNDIIEYLVNNDHLGDIFTTIKNQRIKFQK